MLIFYIIDLTEAIPEAQPWGPCLFVLFGFVFGCLDLTFQTTEIIFGHV